MSSAAASPVSMPARVASHNPSHVLVVDDDPAMRQLVADYLRDNEFRVTTVATGAQMHEALSEHAVDVLLLDLRLGHEDGMELARKVRETEPSPARPEYIRTERGMGYIFTAAVQTVY